MQHAVQRLLSTPPSLSETSVAFGVAVERAERSTENHIYQERAQRSDRVSGAAASNVADERRRGEREFICRHYSPMLRWREKGIHHVASPHSLGKVGSFAAAAARDEFTREIKMVKDRTLSC